MLTELFDTKQSVRQASPDSMEIQLEICWSGCEASWVRLFCIVNRIPTTLRPWAEHTSPFFCSPAKLTVTDDQLESSPSSLASLAASSTRPSLSKNIVSDSSNNPRFSLITSPADAFLTASEMVRNFLEQDGTKTPRSSSSEQMKGSDQFWG